MIAWQPIWKACAEQALHREEMETIAQRGEVGGGSLEYHFTIDVLDYNDEEDFELALTAAINKSVNGIVARAKHDGFTVSCPASPNGASNDDDTVVVEGICCGLFMTMYAKIDSGVIHSMTKCRCK